MQSEHSARLISGTVAGDRRAVDEVAPGDVVVFADGDEHSPVDPYAFDDSAHQ